MRTLVRSLVGLLFLAGFITPASAYIGPGGGLSALGALLALVAGLVIAFVGFVWYPLRQVRRRRRQAELAKRAAARPPAGPQ